MGIEQLVETFKGNPQPLEAKVQQAQQKQPPGSIAPDMEEALALQEILELQNGAKNQQAIQAGGPSPTIMEKMRQMLNGNQQQAGAAPTPPQQGQPPAPQGQPVMAARGGSINQLTSNLGRYYAGGGIIAFAPGGEIKLGTDFAAFLAKMGTDYVSYANSSPEAKASLKEMYAASKGAGPAAGGAAPVPGKAASVASEPGLLRRIAEGTGKVAGKVLRKAGPAGVGLEALSHMGDYKIKAPDDIDTSAAGTISDLAKGEFGRAGTGIKRGLGEAAMDTGSFLANMADLVVPGKAPVSSRYDKFLKENVENLQGPESAAAPTKEESKAGDAETEKLKRLAAARAQTGQNTNPALKPKPPAAAVTPSGPAAPSGPAVTKPEVEVEKPAAPTGLRAAIEANILKDLAKNEDTEFTKGTSRHEKYVGLDSLLAPKNARITEREGMLKKIQGERLPDWVEGFDRASKPMVSGGIGTMLNNLGSGMADKRKGNSAEDLKFFDDISNMKDEVLKLTVEGKYKAAAAGEAAIKAALDAKRQAEQSGTSLLNTDENAAQRRQSAKDAADARVQAAKLAADAKRATGSGNGDKQQLAELKALQASKTTQLKNAYGSDKRRLQSELAIIEAEIAKMAGISTMTPAPGASSPGGTKPGWGKASVI
jgi:hypothetical protein